MPDPGVTESMVPAWPGRVINTLAGALTLLCVLWVVEVPSTFGFAPYNEQFLALVVGLALAITFLGVPAVRGSRTRPPVHDVIAALVGCATLFHVAFAYERLLIDVSVKTPETIAIGAITVTLLMEGLRRTAGHALFLIVLGFILYALVGDLVPGDLRGRPLDLDRLLVYLALDTNALLGKPVEVGAQIVLMFILMGQLLFVSGGGRFFTDLAMATMGNRRGGAAKIAVVASALFGSISGTAVSNVASTGVITIPLMIRSGYSPITAGAIEAVASTGGQLMPPIMGAAAFLMAEFLEISYSEVMMAAILPALLYYFAVFVQVDLLAVRERIEVVAGTLPTVGAVLVGGWHFIIPFVALLYALFGLQTEPEIAALYACALIVVTGLARRYGPERLTVRSVIGSLARTSVVMVELFMIVVAAGYVIGILNVTGLGFALTLFLVNLGGGSLWILLGIAAVICILLGMGMPTGGVYILLATLVAPALVEAGIQDLAAHLFILYFGMMSMITPPIALAAFAAATISRAGPMVTGWASMQLGWVAYLVPFLFVLSPTLLLQGPVLDVVLSTVSACFGVYFATVAVVGYFTRQLHLFKRALIASAGIAALVPDSAVGTGGMLDAAGIGLGTSLLIREFLAVRRNAAQGRLDTAPLPVRDC